MRSCKEAAAAEEEEVEDMLGSLAYVARSTNKGNFVRDPCALYKDGRASVALESQKESRGAP